MEVSIAFNEAVKRLYAKLHRMIETAICLVLSVIPVKRNLVLLEGNGSFDDSTRVLFEKMIELGLNQWYQIIWFMDEPDRHTYLESISGVTVRGFFDSASGKHMSLRGVLLNCTAKVCIYGNRHLGFRKTPGQTRIYLTHGMSIKNTAGVIGDARPHSFVVTPSEFWTPIITQTLPGCEPKIRALGYPRDDALLIEHEPSSMTARFKGMKKLIWMPTFKHLASSTRNDFSQERDNDVSLLTQRSMRKINDALIRRNAVLFVKFHPFQDLSFVNFVSLSNIVSITQRDLDDSGIFLYSLLNEFDALVTDFSSVVYDYLVLDRPIGFDLSDFQDYASGRGLIVDNPFSYMPGAHIYTEDDFIDFIDQVVGGDDAFAAERRALAAKCHANTDGHSSERILELAEIRGQF